MAGRFRVTADRFKLKAVDGSLTFHKLRNILINDWPTRTSENIPPLSGRKPVCFDGI